MGYTLKLKSKELRRLGYPDGPLISQAMRIMLQQYKYIPHDEAITLLKALWESPGTYLADPILGKLAKAIEQRQTPVSDRKTAPPTTYLKTEPTTYPAYGAAGIEAAAVAQIDLAMRLPVAVAGALMPDAHAGYGLPIGGVLATENAVIPYGVGVDIGCRMCLTLYNIPDTYLTGHRDRLTNILWRETVFGTGGEVSHSVADAVLESPDFEQLPVLRGLKDKAARQLGTSGSGNHFVEFGVLTLTDTDAALGVPSGRYVALLSHSGSRGLGATVATHFTQLAMQQTTLPRETRHLAWLDLDTDAGQQYWLAMNLAGDYATACHHLIHGKIARALGETPLAMVENHHNFAWREQHGGRELIVHRKGATPAELGTLGIIPGSMVQPGYLVRGRGVAVALASASHGAGRQLSRAETRSRTTRSALNALLADNGITLLSAGLDEAPLAYKDIHAVMEAQRELVDVLGTFQPRIVRMDAG
jgi:tRNA-splicing ligase RtcB (3'-phosphate/5'-hydroxy nucleic acid ligase)